MTKIEQILRRHDREMQEIREQGEKIKQEMVQGVSEILKNWEGLK